MIVFSRQWFELHQSKLLRFANSWIGRRTLRIHGDRSDVGKHKITRIEPHAITWAEGGNLKTEFRTHAKYSKRLYHAFKPLWYVAHAWDIGIANNLNTALNVGFDTLIKYPDASPEINTVDGFVERNGVNELFNIISAGAGNYASTNNTSRLVGVIASSTANQFETLSRALMTFDTTTIDSSSTVTSASLSLYGQFRSSDLGATDLTVVSSTPASNNSLASSDYSNLGSTSFGSVSYSAYSTSSYNDITLNASGLSNVTKAGISKFGLRIEWDRAGTFSGVWANRAASGYDFWLADYTGTTRDPKLTVTYTTFSQAYYATGNPYASGKMMTYNGSTWADVASSDLYFIAYTTTGATTVAYASQDPSNILRAVIDNYRDNGGTINYDGTSIDNTSTTVSYTFVTQSILDCINKVLELAPVNWYWYVDPATSLIHFHEKSGSADHTLGLGREIKKLKQDKRTDGVVNTIYFRGGDIGGGVFLYKKYQDTNSVGTYGIKAISYVDERVTLTATATVIANNIINARASPEIRLDMEVSDSNTDGFGSDIEMLNVGEVINIQNVAGATGRSLWDLALWDQDRWDYNITQLGSMYLQIVRKEYSPDSAKIFCSTIPPDVSKRIEDINRNLESARTFDNPTQPQ